MEQDIRGSFIGLQISVVGTALLAIASHPAEGATVGAAGIVVLFAGIVVTVRHLY